MNKLLTTAFLGFLTAGSLALTMPSQASAFTSESDVVDNILSRETSPTSPEPDTNLSQSSYEQKVAYQYCYYEIYPDGSYFWVCI